MDTREYQPMLCVFDVLMLNGKVLSNRPLRERKERIHDVFNAAPGRLIVSEVKTGKTKSVPGRCSSTVVL